MSGPLLGLLLALVSASAGASSERARAEARGPQEPFEPVDASRFRNATEVQREYERRMQELNPLVGRLETLSALYASAGDLDSMAKERSEVRPRIQEAWDGFGQLTIAFDNLRKMEHVEQLRTILKGEPKDLGERIARAMSLEEFSKASRDYGKNIGRVLNTDAELFAAAVTARRRRRQLLFGGAGAALALGAGLWLRRRRGAPAGAGPAAPVSAPVLPSSGPLTLPPAFGASSPALGSSPAASAALLSQALPAGSGPPQGSVLAGNFRVERELGRDGMGLVYEALDLTLERKVAIKQMRDELSANPKDLEMFLSEARLVAALEHPNVVKIHGVAREGGRVYLVFEFVSGQPLDRVIEAHGRLPLGTVKGLLAHVAAALDYAHSRQVIHRDLKPANIMITEERIAKVMDFGLAHKAKVTVARLTKAESWGTYAYMAPEQELGEVSRESDLYSLAVCLYEAATGKLPFGGPNFLAQKQELRYQPPSQAAGLPPAFDAFMARALHPEAASRFHSGAEMLAALTAV